MAKSQAQRNAERSVMRERNASLISARNTRAKEQGIDLNTATNQIKAEQRSASLKRLYGDDLDTTNPAAVNAARAAKQAAKLQTNMDARQARDTASAAKLAIAEKQAEQENAAQRVIQLKEGADRVAASGAAEDAARAQKQADTIARMEAARQNPIQAARQAAPAPEAAMGKMAGAAPNSSLPTPTLPMSSSMAATMGSTPMPAQRAAGPTPLAQQTFVPPAAQTKAMFKRGGPVKKMSSGGMTSQVSQASKRGDGIAQRGKTKGRMC